MWKYDLYQKMEEFNKLHQNKRVEMIPTIHQNVIHVRLMEKYNHVQLYIERHGDVEYLFQEVGLSGGMDVVSSMDYVCLNENDLFKHITDVFEE
jgi:hypothetical protein